MFSNLMSYNHGTIILYCFIVAFATLLAKLSQKRLIIDTEGNMVRRYDRYIYFGCFLFVAFFAAFNGVGADKPSYAYFFSTSSFERILSGSEPGYELSMWLSRFLIKDSNVFLTLFGLFTIINVFWGLWKLRANISIPWAIFIFTSQYYFQGFNLMRMYFAVSLLILFANYIIEEKYIKYIVVLCIASTFHYSILFVLLAYVIAFVINRMLKGNFGIKLVALMVASVVFSTFALRGITGVLGYGNAIVYKYSGYLSNVSLASTGIKWIFNIIPFLFVVVLLRMNYQRNMYISITVSYLIFSLIISLLSYSVPVIGRALIGLNLPILVYLPMAIELFKREALNKSDYSVYLPFGKRTLVIRFSTLKYVMIIYFIFSLLLYLSEYMGPDQIDNFRFIWS